jgi:hypothetical protein
MFSVSYLCLSNARNKSYVLHLVCRCGFVGLARYVGVADIDIVTSCGDIHTGLKAPDDIAAPDCATQRSRNNSRIAAAGPIPNVLRLIMRKSRRLGDGSAHRN